MALKNTGSLDMTDAASYHASVRHYHAPFPLSHRNARVFSSSSYASKPSASPASTAATHHTPTLKSDDGSRVSRKRSPPRAASPSRLLPGQYEHDLPLGDHFYGASMVPSPSPFQHLNSSSVMSPADASYAWQEHKSLLFQGRGKPFGAPHRQIKEPYVSPNEFVDPLSGTRPNRKVASFFVAKKCMDAHSRGAEPTCLMVAFGERRAAANSFDVAPKINWIDPRTGKDTFSAKMNSTTHSAPGSTSHQHARSIHTLPSTPLLSEVEERLALQGLGSLLDVRHASDDAVSGLLKAIGLDARSRMAALWELRCAIPDG